MFKSLFGPPDIKKLKENGDVEGLIKALQYNKEKSGTPEFGKTPNAAAEALGILGDLRAVDPLIIALDQWDPFLSRNSIIKSLGLLKDQRAVGPLLQVLKKKDIRDNRSTILWALARLRSPLAINPLIEILQDKTYNNRGDRDYAEAALSLMGTACTEPLILLARNDPWQYFTVAKVFSRTKDPRAVEFLLTLVSDKDIMKEDSVVPGEIIHALGQIGDKRAIEALQALVRGGDRNLGDRARVALDMITAENVPSNYNDDDFFNELTKDYSKKSNDELIRLLLADNPNKSFLIPLVLGRRKATQAVEALCQNLFGKGVSYGVRLESVVALGKIKDKKAIEPLIQAFDIDWAFKPEIFQAIETSLEELGWKPH